MALEPDRWVFSMVSEPNVSQGSLWMLPGALLGPLPGHSLAPHRVPKSVTFGVILVRIGTPVSVNLAKSCHNTASKPLKHLRNNYVTFMLPSCYPHVTLMPLTCPSLATHLLLTCRSLTSCGPPRSQQLQKKAQRSVLVRACLENSFLCSPESAQCVFFVVNTICSEGSFTALCHHVNRYGVSKCHDTVTN